MYTPDEHFMAVGREEIRKLALGTEMAGLDGWHYDYVATVMDEANGMVVGFWKQRAGIEDERPASEYEILGIGGSWFGLRRGPDGARRSPGSATGSTSARPRTRSCRWPARARRRSRCSTGWGCTARRSRATTPRADLPSTVWPPVVGR